MKMARTPRILWESHRDGSNLRDSCEVETGVVGLLQRCRPQKKCGIKFNCNAAIAVPQMARQES